MAQRSQHNQRLGQTAIMTEEQKLNEEIDFDSDYLNQNQIFLNRQTSAFPQNNNQDERDEKFEQLYNQKRYVPVALVIETETEYHDTFRQMMLSLFDLIRVPANYFEKSVIDNRILAFAELIAHLAFLKTIPAPIFNSVYHIHCLNHVFTIKESSFDQIPHKNQFPIKILFDVLDVRSIFYCWKALLFDKTLVLVSSQYSLQFYVAEALKQLLFPMTWQNTYIQPGNESLSGHADGTMVVIYGSNSIVNGFDFFDGMSPEMAVCDIDACFTNNIDLPCLPDEQMYIRILNMLKNSRINQYDKAYPDSQVIDSEDFVQQVRETFFGLLKPYLQRVEDFIDQSVDPSTAYFGKYFKTAEYIDHFEVYSDLHHKFAKALVQSSQFVHFCDDYFSDELNNYQILQEIFKSRGEIQIKETHFSDRKRSNFIENFNFEEFQQQTLRKGKSLWPDTEPVIFNFRLPRDDLKVMLFEKLLFMNESSMMKKEQDITRKTNEHLLQNKDHLHFDKIIQNIRDLYPSKHQVLMKMQTKQQQLVNNTINEAYQRRINGMSTVDARVKQQPKQHQSQLMITNAANSKHQPSQSPVNQRRRPIQKVQSSDSIQVVVIEGGDTPLLRGAQPERSSLLVDAQKIPMRFIGNNSNNFNSPSTNQDKNDQTNQTQLGLKLQLNFTNNGNNHLKVPSELVNSQNEEIIGTPSLMQISMNSNVNPFQDEQNRVQQCSRRISKLMYGQQGLVCFLNHLFGLLNEKQMKQVNFHFTLKEQVQVLCDYERKQNLQRKEKLKNTQIQEDAEEDKTPSNKGQRNDQSLEKLPNTHQTRSRVYSHSKNNANGHAGTTSTSTYSQKIFKTDKEWFNVDQWETNAYTLKRTYQFILFKTKMYEASECPEDGYSLIWKELLKFPVHKMKFFPRTKFMNIWEKLTHNQQYELFTKLGQKPSKPPHIEMISKDFYTRTRSTTALSTVASGTESVYNNNSGSKSDEGLFFGACIKKSWVQKRNEKRERDTLKRIRSAQQTTNPNQSQPNSTFNSSYNSSSKKQSECKLDQIKKMKDTNQKNIADSIKSRLSQRQANDLDLKKKQSCSAQKLDTLKIPPLSSRSHTQDEHTSFKFTNTPDRLPTPQKDVRILGQHNEYSKSQFQLDNATTHSSGGGFSCESKTFYAGNAVNKKQESAARGQDYDLNLNPKKRSTQISRMKDAESIVTRMLNKMINIWRSKSKFVSKRGYFIEEEINSVIQEMEKFEQYFRYLKVTTPEIDNEIEKQVFFLNLFNFLVLHQIAVLMISSPEAIEKLTNYNMWQSLLVSATIKLGGHKISAYSIMHSILRYAYKPPLISQFLLNTPAIEFDCLQFQVKDPSKLLAFGFFLPLKGMPKLRIYNSSEYENQLRSVAQEFLVKKVRVKEDFKFIMLPRFMKWYQRDFCEECYIIDLLKFIEYGVFLGKSPLAIGKLLDKIAAKKLSTHDIILDYKPFSFEFKPSKMAYYFPGSNEQGIHD